MGNWQQSYDEKLVSAKEAAAAIESGDHIWLPVGAGEPDTDAVPPVKLQAA